MQRSEMAVSILLGRHFDSVGTGNVKPVDFQKICWQMSLGERTRLNRLQELPGVWE